MEIDEGKGCAVGGIRLKVSACPFASRGLARSRLIRFAFLVVVCSLLVVFAVAVVPFVVLVDCSLLFVVVCSLLLLLFSSPFP
jgi:hypothetical protein